MTHATPELLAVLHALLDQALDLAPPEREAWLARLRLEQPAHAAELEALLAAEAGLDASRFLADPDWGELMPPARVGLAGQRLGAYTLDRPLGQGGMGTVWLAHRSDGRYAGNVAVKLLNLALLDSIGSERFGREGTVLARLSHPNIARLLDAGVTDGGQPYLVLEHVEGTRIDRYADDQRLSPEARLRLFLDVLGAVAHAHANLIVHRDIKPSNILVTQDGTVKLLDFGIAKLLEGDAAGANASTLTDVGGRALTPEYASPEQISGGTVTTATDVYALGVLLYVLLAGRHPTSEGSQSTAEHLRGILETDPPRLSTAVTASGFRPRDEVARAAAARSVAPDRLRRLYLGDLDNIVAKALKKRPEERYGTVGAFADDLRRYLAYEPVRARPDTVGYRARKFVRRNRTPVVAGGLVALALVAATVVTTAQMVEARRQRDEARAQRDRAIYQEQRATASRGFMETLLQSVAPAGRPYTTLELLGRARELLQRDFRADPRFVARMMIDLSAHYAAIDNVSEQLALLERAASLAAGAGDDETATNAECTIALLQAGRENAAEARPHLERGVRSLARVRQPAVRARMQCLLAQGQLAIADGPEDRALPLARRAVALAEAAGDTASVAYADALATVATQLHNQNRVRDALDATRRTIATLDRIGRGSTLPMLDARLDEARYLRDLGEMRTADSVLDVVVRLAKRVDPRNVAAKVSILAGEVAQGRDRPDSAVAAYEGALAEARRTGDAFREQWALERLVAVLADYKRVAHGRKRLAELTAIIPEGDRATLGMLEARFAQTGGDPARAYRTYMAALTERGFPDNPDIPPWHRIVFRAAQAALAGGDAAAADSLARHAIRLERALGAGDARSGDIGLALVVLARARLAQGDSSGARDALERAIAPLEYGFGPDDRRAREARLTLESGRPL